MLEKGFYKVAESGGSYVVDTFFNPTTGESFTKCVRDYDYMDCSRDIDELYNMPIDYEARKAWLHSKGTILVGDQVEVVKGRKIKVGTVATVTKIYDWHDKYGRWQTRYVVFEDGRKTNIDNCILKES